MGNRIAKYIVALFVPVFIMGCKQNTEKTAKAKIPRVKIEQVKKELVSVPIRAIGHIAPAKTIKLSFKIGGIIDQLSVREGDRVKKDQVVARLKPDEIESKVFQARLAVEKADRDLQRVENLYNDSVATLEQLQNTQTAFQLSKYDLRVAEFNLKHSVIKSPVNGTVLSKLAEVGEVIGQGYPVVVVSSKDRNMVVYASVTDKEWREIAMGDRVKIHIDAVKNKTFDGYISQVEQISDPYTGTYAIECSFNAMPQRIAPGMMSRVQIEPKSKHERFVVPVDALVEASGTSGIVYTINAGLIEAKQVEIDRVFDGKLIVLNGLSENDNVVTDGKKYVNEGDRVEIATD